MTLVGCEDSEASRRGSGGDGDVLESGIMGARPIKDRSGMASFLNAERQDAPSIEVFEGGQPLA